MSSLFLIRHGKTIANELGLYCGSTDLPLSDEGRKKLVELNYNISSVRFITSGMKRTEETLELLFGNIPHEQNKAFRELNFGRFEMKSYDDLKDDGDYQRWISGDNELNVAPDGESGAQLKKRVIEAFEALYPLTCDTAIVTHGGVIALIMDRIFPEEKKSRYQWQPKPGHGYEIQANSYRPIP